MIYMDDIMIGFGEARHSLTLSELADDLIYRAKDLYARGWDVIGSYFKRPNLHPWKGISRETLLNLACQNFASQRANSINLRLQGHEVIALDMDFPDEELTFAFLTSIATTDLCPWQSFYTVQGGKGCKLFFNMQGIRPARVPNVIGPICYPKDHVGDDNFKTVMELKSDLSTVYGAYPHPTGGALYSEFPKTQFIATASPDDLPCLSWDDLDRLKNRFVSLLSQMGYVGQEGKPLVNLSLQSQTLRCVICFYLAHAQKNNLGIALMEFLRFYGFQEIQRGFIDFASNLDDFTNFTNKNQYDFTLLPENSPMRQDVKWAYDLLEQNNWQVIQTLADDFDVYFSHEREGLLEQLVRYGVAFNDDDIDTVSLFDKCQFSNWQHEHQEA